jgi:hypothetical protein
MIGSVISIDLSQKPYPAQSPEPEEELRVSAPASTVKECLFQEAMVFSV